MADNLPMSYNDMKGIAKDFVESGLFSQFKNPQQALVTIMAGHEFGLGPFEAMTSIYVVQGKPSFYSHKFADMLKRSGKYNYRVKEHTDKVCSIDFLEKSESNWEIVGNSTFTVEDAQKADLLKNPNFTKYPRNMLYARAMTNGAKWYCPDAFNGTGAYEPSELGADVEWAEDGTQTVVNVPEPEVTTKPYVADSVPTEQSDTGNAQTHFKQEWKDETKMGTEAKELTINTFTELQSANGRPYAKITFLDVFTVEGYKPRWDEYNVSPFIFEERPEMYRGLENGTRVLVSLTFEKVGEKNYQNCEISRVMEDEVVIETEDSVSDVQEESNL
jgi:hypothetical protein